MNKGFPHKNWLGLPKGWQDRGPVKLTIDPTGKNHVIGIHLYCKSVLRIGIDFDGSRFKFCPMCLVKTRYSPTEDKFAN